MPKRNKGGFTTARKWHFLRGKSAVCRESYRSEKRWHEEFARTRKLARLMAVMGSRGCAYSGQFLI